MSINHRLNAFGFLHLGALGEQYATSVNAGMLDIVAALAWVRDNIATFGGDPSNVTVFGQSGGGAKVNFLMAMPSAVGLFHKAIVQSATPMTGNARTIEFSIRQTALMLRGLGLATVEQLQALPHDTLRDAYSAAGFQTEFELDARSRWGCLDAAELGLIEFDFRQPARNVARLKTLLQTRYGYDEREAQKEVTRFSSRVYSDNIGPIADGRVIVQASFNPAAPDVSAGVPVLVGHALNEGGGPNFFTEAREQWTETEMRAELATRPEPVPDVVVEGLRKAYPTARPVEIYAHTLNQGGLAYRIDALSLAGRKVMQNSAPAYVYIFAWKTRVMDGRPRAFHRSELPFVFDNTDRCAHQTGGTDEARTMAAKVSDAWVAFARTGNPNHAAIPVWPAFDAERVPTMVFDDTCEVRLDHDRVARLAFERR